MRFVFITCVLIMFAQGAWADTFSDTFNTQSYSRNNGNKDFLTDWVESGDNGSPGSPSNSNDVGIELIFFGLFGGELFLKDGNSEIQRTLDLSGYTTATLSFDYREEDFDSNGDQVRVQISTGGGWTTLNNFRGSNGEVIHVKIIIIA